jgi:hypothetical protein
MAPTATCASQKLGTRGCAQVGLEMKVRFMSVEKTLADSYGPMLPCSKCARQEERRDYPG